MRNHPHRTRLGILAIAAGAALGGAVLVSAGAALAFNGPSQAPSGGYGAIGSDGSNNVAIGTSTTVSGTKLLVVGATSDNTTYPAQFWANNTTPIFILRSDGSVSIETSTISAGNTVIGGNLTAGGNLTIGGTFNASALTGTLVAGNVSSGQFGSNVGGANYSFPGRVGIGNVAPSSNLYIEADGLGATASSSAGITLYNGTAAASGAQQVSPPIILTSNGWATTGSTSEPTSWLIYNLPVQGTTPSADFLIQSSINGGAYTTRFTLTSAGALTLGSSLGISGALTGATTGAFSSAVTLTKTAVATSTTNDLILTNTTAATAASPEQNSPAIEFSGTAYNSASKVNAMSIQETTIPGAPSGGRIDFLDQTVDGSANTSTLFSILSTGNVGIGTTTPAYTLDVNGAASFEGNVIHNIGTPTVSTDAANKAYVDAAVSGGGGPWTLSGSDVYTTNTNYNVGIGTASPASALDVYGTISVSGTPALYSPNTSSWFIGNAGNTTLTGTNDTVAGNNAGGALVGGSSETLIGSGAGKSLTTGNTNTAIGYLALNAAITTSANTAVGQTALRYLTSGNGEIAIGATAGEFYGGTSNDLTTLTNGSIIIGDSAEPLNNSDSNEIVIGGGTSGGLGNGSNSVTLGDAQTTHNYFPYGSLSVNTTSTANTLNVNGSGDFEGYVVHNVGTPIVGTDAANKAYVDTAVTGGGTGTFSTLTVTGNWSITGAAQANLNMNGYNITSVGTLQVTTIDPLYQIGGTDYETFAPESIGVNDVVNGEGTLIKKGSDYEYAINFPQLPKGSDLWVWYQTVDFGKDTVQALATPYGAPAEIYYTIDGSTLTFHGNAPAQFSFQLTGKRFDWQKWPTTAADQTRTPGFVLPVKE